MNSNPTPFDQVIHETIHQSGGFEFMGDPSQSLNKPAEELTGHFEVSPTGAKLIVPGATVGNQLKIWREANLVADARKLLCHALPPRYALWWALLSLFEAHRQNPYSPEIVKALALTRDFLIQPSDGKRRQFREAGKKAGMTSPGGVLAYAAFLSGGSMAPTNCPPVLPKPQLCGRLCAAVVYLASVRFHPARYKQNLQHFLGIGLQIAQGKLEIPSLKDTPSAIPAQKLGLDASELIKKELILEQVHGATQLPQARIAVQ